MPYFHVVFSLPAQIADIAYQNKAAIYGILFKASAETMLTIAADPKHLGARIGFLSVLHTWGSALTHHPHVHMIVPGGGISPDGTRWIACRPNFLLAVEVLSCLFRRLVLEKLTAAHRAGAALVSVSKACPGEAHCRSSRRRAAVLRQAHCPDQSKSLRGLLGAAAPQRLGRLCQASIRGTGGSPALSGALRPPRRHFQPPPDFSRRQGRHLQVEGLPA